MENNLVLKLVEKYNYLIWPQVRYYLLRNNNFTKEELYSVGKTGLYNAIRINFDPSNEHAAAYLSKIIRGAISRYVHIFIDGVPVVPMDVIPEVGDDAQNVEEVILENDEEREKKKKKQRRILYLRQCLCSKGLLTLRQREAVLFVNYWRMSRSKAGKAMGFKSTNRVKQLLDGFTDSKGLWHRGAYEKLLGCVKSKFKEREIRE
ncbi:hypothetical protein ACFL43_01875 [Thermodesulfobacteriota bacterium]